MKLEMILIQQREITYSPLTRIASRIRFIATT